MIRKIHFEIFFLVFYFKTKNGKREILKFLFMIIFFGHVLIHYYLCVCFSSGEFLSGVCWILKKSLVILFLYFFLFLRTMSQVFFFTVMGSIIAANLLFSENVCVCLCLPRLLGNVTLWCVC